ncbi:MAG: hypothetical protein EPO24_06150, partial [Bacteroidetes bacterium]
MNNNIESLNFGLVPFFKITNLILNGDDADFEQGRDGVIIEDVPTDTVADVVFEYEGKMSFHTEFSRLDEERAVLREEEILPHAPRNLQFFRFSIEVPSDWDAVAPGVLVKRDSLPNSNLFVWEYDEPVPMIGWILAGKFVKDSKKEGSTPISTYLFSEDSSHSKRIMSLADSVLLFYNSKFTPFRFHNLNIIEVENWVAGKSVLAISIPSIIMIKKQAFETEDVFNTYPLILAHEVAHQWWPATVFI